MTGITGGTNVATRVGARIAGSADAPAPGPGPTDVGATELRVLDAVIACTARWGLDKTTVDDVAREAGVSRATVYRLFPGGKPSMVTMATDREAIMLLVAALERIDATDSLEDAVAEMICAGTDTLRSQAVLAYMAENEHSRLRAFFSFDRLDSLLQLAAGVVSPSLERFLDHAESRNVVIWVARLVVSHFVQPEHTVDLSDPAVARHLTQSYILPGLRMQSDPTVNPDLTNPQEQHR